MILLQHSKTIFQGITTTLGTRATSVWEEKWSQTPNAAWADKDLQPVSWGKTITKRANPI